MLNRGAVQAALYSKEVFNDEDKEKRRKFKLPNTMSFKTKPQLAIEMLSKIIDQNTLPFKYVLADTVYESNPDFIEAIEQNTDLTYFVSVPSDNKCWIKNTFVIKKQYKYENKIKMIKNLDKCQEKPIKFMDLAKKTNQPVPKYIQKIRLI